MTMSNTGSPNDEAARTVRGAEPTMIDRTVSGGTLSTVVVDGASSFGRARASTATHNAILHSLHEERSMLTRKRRIGKMSDAETAQLQELEAYIDEMEIAESHDASAAVWARLEAIAGRVVSLGAGIERKR